ncbi:helix-turn-helix domain-containing protein [Pseudoflavonifractor phocaeensis]|uniref:helix-turn-helix domain-containing protein n=1 Tax=Pseudoflavonifractor phocaeensis TaxID=1870988 RepID=UPI001F437443|nr:helix-turn-helix domain-containing protein [Pseudoflavonifractor phocaeensis]MCF2661219.1 helix-turn-helix domain-containing protein [Pseudoflavonifractor phocaeensis]
MTLQEWTGQLVMQAREEQGYSQQYVADEVEIDLRTLKKIEEGKSDPDYITIYKLIHLLYISPKIMFYAEQSQAGLTMDHEYRRLLRFTPDQIAMISESALHVRSWYESHPDEYQEFMEKNGLC